MDDIDLTKVRYRPWTDFTRIPFGKFKGLILRRVPASYLLWWYEQQKEIKQFHGLALYIEGKFSQLEEEAQEEKENDGCDASEADIY